MTPTDVKLPRSHARAVLRLLGLISLCLTFFIPVLLLWVFAQDGLRSRLVHVFYRIALWICGVQCKIEGELSARRPLLLVANHSSYLDILVLGSLLPLSFTPKREIRSWPVIGFFCVLADCVFIERRPAYMQEAQAEMQEKLRAGKVVALFPEGTTGDGYNVMPFKSGFLSLLEGQDLPLQAVTVAYTHIGQVPLSAATRENVAWIGEASLVTHLMRLFSFPCVRVTVRVYPVKHMQDYDGRKAIAKAAEERVAKGLRELLEANGVTG